MIIRKCTKCRKSKPIIEYNKNGNRYGKQEYRTQCRDCLIPMHNPDRTRVARYKYKNPEKVRSQWMLRYNIEKGKIDKPDSCSECKKNMPKNKIQGHHEDYSKPLDVIWLCDLHHKKRHKEINEKINLSNSYLFRYLT